MPSGTSNSVIFQKVIADLSYGSVCSLALAGVYLLKSQRDAGGSQPHKSTSQGKNTSGNLAAVPTAQAGMYVRWHSQPTPFLSDHTLITFMYEVVSTTESFVMVMGNLNRNCANIPLTRTSTLFGEWENSVRILMYMAWGSIIIYSSICWISFSKPLKMRVYIFLSLWGWEYA